MQVRSFNHIFWFVTFLCFFFFFSSRRRHTRFDCDWSSDVCSSDLPSVYRRLMDRQTHRIGGRLWSVVMGYGHAPEHAALYCEELGVLISGDMVLPRISTNVSVWANEPEGNPLALFLESLSRYAGLPATTLTLPSHGLPFGGLRERIAQLKEHHRLRLAELHEACGRSEERRVGKECRSRWSPYH